MIEPTLALQTAIRNHLITDPAIIALVPPESIRFGSTKPEKFPLIVLSNGTTEYFGQAYTRQRVVNVFIDMHVWTINGGLGTAQSISFAVRNRLDQAPPHEGFWIDHFKVQRIVFPRDPDPKYGHGVLNVEAVMRWLL